MTYRGIESNNLPLGVRLESLNLRLNPKNDQELLLDEPGDPESFEEASERMKMPGMWYRRGSGVTSVIGYTTHEDAKMAYNLVSQVKSPKNKKE